MVTTIAALAVAFIMRELPLRTTQGHGPSKAKDKHSESASAPTGARPTAAPALD